MQTMLQLSPPIPLKTPRGEGLAILVIDYGPDHDLWWTVIVSKGEHAGEVWTYANPEVRGVNNLTLGRQSSPERALVKSLGPEPEECPRPGNEEHNGHAIPRPRRGF